MVSEDAQKCGTCCCIFITILSVFLFAFSFNTIDVPEWGLKYNTVTLKVATDGTHGPAFESGRYFTGLAQKFIYFPRRSQYIEFSNNADGGYHNSAMSVWSKDGQDVKLEVGFFYYLVPEKLLQIYNDHGSDERNNRAPYEHYFEDLAQSAIKNECVNYETTEYFTNRVAIDAALNAAVSARLGAAGANISAFNLLSIDVPNDFENALIEKVVKGQEKSILEFTQLAIEKRAEIKVIDGQANFNITRLMAQAAANATLIMAQQTAAADKLVLDEKTRVYRNLALELGFAVNGSTAEGGSTDNAALLNYLWSSVIGSSDGSSKIVAGFSQPMITV